MPCGKEKLIIRQNPTDAEEAIQDGTLFGFAQVDIEVPSELREKFHEFSPLFVVGEVPDDQLPKFMKDYKLDTVRKTVKGTKKLMGVMKATEILHYTPFIGWYLDHGLKITAAHQLLTYNQSKQFTWFVDEVTTERREADMDAEKKQKPATLQS